MKFLIIHSFPLSWEGKMHFSRLLRDVGIVEKDCTQLTILSKTPGEGRKKGDFTKLCCKKEVALAEWGQLQKDGIVNGEFNLPKYRNKFIQPLSVIGDLQKFQSSLDEVRAKENFTCTIGLGPVAAWHLLRDGALDKHRGTFVKHAEVGKVIFSYCMEQVFEFYTRNTILMFDLMKMKQDCEKRGGEVYVPDVEFWLEPALEDLYDFGEYLTSKKETTFHLGTPCGEQTRGGPVIAESGLACCASEASYNRLAVDDGLTGPSTSLQFQDQDERFSPLVGIDIETRHGMITSISFSTKDKSLVVPFILLNETSYWDEDFVELAVWKWVKVICENKNIPKVFQNGMYDVQYLFGRYGIKVNGWVHDTMFMAHSKFSELNKDLGTLASFYTNFPSWKYGLAETKVEK